MELIEISLVLLHKLALTTEVGGGAVVPLALFGSYRVIRI